MRKLKKSQKGFTLIELMIATIIFAGILLGATTILLQINKLYFGSITNTQTQELTRLVMNNISQEMQFTDAVVISNGTTQIQLNPSKADIGVLCIGTTRYTYALNAQVEANTPVGDYNTMTNHHIKHALWQDLIPSSNAANCVPVDLSQDQPSPAGTELLKQHMRLGRFSANCDANSHYCSADIQVIYGDDDLIEFNVTGNPVKCQSIIGNQWCSVSQLSTHVYQRVHTGS